MLKTLVVGGVLAALAAGVLVACEDTSPQSAQMAGAYKVETLFKLNGCDVDRFMDHGYSHYIVMCPDNRTVVGSSSYQCGKTTCVEEISQVSVR